MYSSHFPIIRITDHSVVVARATEPHPVSTFPLVLTGRLKKVTVAQWCRFSEVLAQGACQVWEAMLLLTSEVPPLPSGPFLSSLAENGPYLKPPPSSKLEAMPCMRLQALYFHLSKLGFLFGQ